LVSRINQKQQNMMMNQKGRRRMRTIDEGGEDIVAVPQ